MLPSHVMHTYLAPDPLPPEAVELFGNDVQEAWDSHESPMSPTQACIGVTTDGQWLAGIWMAFESLEQAAGAPEAVASIKLLVVTPAARGQGVAGRLLHKAMNLAREQGCTRIRSTAGFGCPDHLSMYRRLGFESTGAREMPYLVNKPV